MNRETAAPSIKVTPPGPISQKWTDYNMAHAPESIYYHPFVWDKSAPAIGPFCTDPDGNVILDFSSHGAAFPLGYNNPELIDIAQKAASVMPDRQGIEVLGVYGDDPGKIVVPTPAHLVNKLAQIAKPIGLDCTFLSNSGAEAVENAIKACYACRRNLGFNISFQGAFHGRTMGATTITRSRKNMRKWYPQIPNHIDLPFCHCKGECKCGWKVYTVKGKGIMTQLEHLLDPDIGLLDPDEVAFIIVEPVQGEGGYNIPAPGFLESVENTAKKYGIPLICDEVQSGLGRTGKWFALEHFGIKPDYICLGKTLAVGATMAKREMFPQERSRLGGTWVGGNAVSTAVGYKRLEIIERDNLLENATKMGARFLNGFKELEKLHPHTHDATGLGLMVSIRFDDISLPSKVADEAFKHGLCVFPCGFEGLRFIAPLDVRAREVDMALEILDKAIAAV